MNIELVRIDDRLIHGQVIMAWQRVIDIAHMVIIDDKVAMDIIYRMLLETVTPPGIKVSVFSVEQGLEALRRNAFGNEKILLLFTKPSNIVKLVEAGVVINKVNIGGMSFGQGKAKLTQTVFVDEYDRDAFRKLDKRGVSLQIQMLPSDDPINMMTKL